MFFLLLAGAALAYGSVSRLPMLFRPLTGLMKFGSRPLASFHRFPREPQVRQILQAR